MSLFVFDTDHLTLYQMGHAQVVRKIMMHLSDHMAICVVTVEEQLSGWQTGLHQAKDDIRREAIYRRMALAIESLASWTVLPFPLAAMSRHAKLVRQRLNVRSNDLKIAAIALEGQAAVVTRNLRDFGRVPGLLIEDWSV